MSSNLEWIIEEDATDYDELIGVPRESGDGESKETSPHISASEDDNQDCKQALIESNRRVDRKKDKKVSKIPVRQVKLSNHVDVGASTYGNDCHFEQPEFAEKVEISEELDNISNNSKSTVVENCIQTDATTLAISEYDFSEKMFKLKLSETHDNFDGSLSDSIINNKLTDKPTMKENDKTNLGYRNALKIDSKRCKGQQCNVEKEQIIKSGDASITNLPDISDSTKKIILNTKSDNINICDNILEAPEEFRSLQEIGKSFDSADLAEISLSQYPNILQDETTCRIIHGNVGEPSQCHLSAPDRDHDKANTPEASNVYKLELNKDIVIPNPGIKMDVSFNTPKLKPSQICMTNEEEHGVIEPTRSSRKVNGNECAKVAAPSETIEIIHNVVDDEGVFTDIIGGAVRDNDHIQSDSMDILKTKATADQNINDTCSSDVYLLNEGTKSGKIKPHRDNEDSNSEYSRFNEITGIANVPAVSCITEMNPKLEVNITSIGFKTNDCTVTLSNVYEPRPDNSCSFERDSVNGSSCLVSNIGAFACAENEQTLTTAKASIEIGVARCAQAPRCSRNSTATVCTVPTSDSSNFSSVLLNLPQLNDSVTEKCKCETPTLHTLKNNCEILSDNANNQNPPAQFKSVHTDSDIIARDNIFNENFCNSESHLVWQFKNGRLVFEKLNDQDEKCKLEELEPSSRPCEELQSHSEDKIVPALLQVIEKCDKKIESSVNKLTKESETEGNEVIDVLCSKDLNKRIVEGRSRLKHLENKLKEAGITDGKTKCLSDLNQSESETGKYKLTREYLNDIQAVPCEISGNKENTEQVVDKLAETLVKANVNFDDNQNVVYSHAANQLKIIKTESREEQVKELNGSENKVEFVGGSCEFDVRQINSFSDFLNPDFYVVYDELEDCSDEDDCEHEHYHIISEMRGDGSMGTNGERTKNHNPDRENLKSLLKKPGRSRDVKKNRVVFNENKNEFFDADYIILIREECDYDDEEDDGVCTCNEHEMVRLTCCEPNCNCNIYDGYSSDPTPQSPKFAPPLEFVDAVTLSPPEGYKDMELGEQEILALQQMARRGQRTAVCRDCSATHEDEGEGSQSDNEDNEEVQSDHEDSKEETQKTDQSQQTTPTTPPASDTDNDNQHQYIIETISAKEKRIMEELEDDKQLPSSPCLPVGGSPISGILKGGRLWKQHNQDLNNVRNVEQPATDSSVTSDEESNGNKRSVRFTESNENTRDSCDGAADKTMEESSKEDESFEEKQDNGCANSVSPESTEMMLTFKLGNHILISNNSLKPNSAVRQLFPCSKPLSNKPGESDSIHQYLVTAESLKAFEEAKRSKLPQIIQSDETDESIKRAIERNTLRRSLIRYEPRPKKKEQKTDNSLIERIKQLTCDVDDEARESQDISHRTSPPGEEARKSPEFNQLTVKNTDKSFSPSSSSTGSSNSSSVSSTYKKITDLFAKREKLPDIQNNTIVDSFQKPPGMAPDLGNTANTQHNYGAHQCSASKATTVNDSRKQFLAPLTACVSGTVGEEHYYHITHHIGDRTSVTSSVGTEYSLEDIDEGLKKEDEDPKRNAPDVVVGTPSASESGDELAMFVQQDAGRIERIKKKYQQDNNEDDEHDDYGFNKRPSVRGIKPRFGTTNEILQQIQNQMQPPLTNQKLNSQVNWPYYSEASLSNLDNNKSRNPNQNLPQYKYTYVAEEMKAKMYVHQYRPPGFIDDNIYQNCANQQCNREINYKTNVNHVHSPVMRIGGACTEAYHQAIASKSRNGRPESPPPFDVAKNIHQTMVYIPYNHIEPYQPSCASPNPQYASNDKCYARVVNQNQINNRYIEPVYLNQPRMNHPHAVEEVHYQINAIKQIPKPAMRLPYPLPNSSTQPHLISSRSESPLPGQFSTARSTQTSAPVMSTCNNYYPRYRPVIGPIAVAHSGMPYHENVYSTKINRHSFPTAALRYQAPDSISLTDSESQYSVQVPNGFRQCIETTFPVQKESAPNSPTKSRFIERGVPEGAASVSPQDSTAAQSTSTMTSPTSPQNPIQGTKPMYYAMNV